MAPARLVGINHVAIEVGDLDAALEFYSALFTFRIRGHAPRLAFVDMGDQFLAISEGRTQAPDFHRHFGLVVDDKAAVRRALEEAGIDPLPGAGLDFRDPWGNLVQIVEYHDIQFSKAPPVLRGMGLLGLEKSEQARRELSEKGLDGG